MGKKGELLQSQVIDVLNGEANPMSAYGILEQLRLIHPKIAPTTVYRALSALTDQGHVHRLESLNAYMVCRHQEEPHDSVLAICDDCGSVEESVAPQVIEDLSKVAEKSGFSPTRQVVEIHGVCADCGQPSDTKR